MADSQDSTAPPIFYLGHMEETNMTQAHFGKNYAGNAPENYERYFVPTIGAPLARTLVDRAELEAGQRVLDVACGTGVVARLAKEQVGTTGSVSGLDVNAGMLSVARSVTPEELRIDWYETSAESSPLPDDRFDVILCQMGLQFIPKKLGALKEIQRMLKPGGKAFLNLPGPTPDHFEIFAKGLQKHINPELTKFVEVVFSMHDEKLLRNLMGEAGFEDIRTTRETESLALPEPEDFMWQYIYSTPLGIGVGNASDEQKSALEADVCGQWKKLGRTAKVGMTTVSGRKPA